MDPLLPVAEYNSIIYFEMSRANRKRKIRDGFCHCSVCDQLPSGSARIERYDEENLDTGKSCYCNGCIISKSCYRANRRCFVCSKLCLDDIINAKNRSNFSWFLNDENKLKVRIFFHLPW